MRVFLYLEASQSSCGNRYRLGLGCAIHPQVASILVFVLRLF
jgi:hypothetical protein